MWASEGDEITYLKGDKYRNESKVERSGMVAPIPLKDPPPRVTIIRLDEEIMWRVNLKDRTYQEIPLATLQERAEGKAHFKIKAADVEATGETREIVGRTCKGVKAVVTSEVDMGDEVVDQTLDMVFWMTEETEGLEEMKTFWERSLSLAQGQDQEIPLWDALEKMWKESEEFKGIPLGFRVTIEALLDDDKKAEIREAVQAMLKAEAGEGATGEIEVPDEGMKIIREVESISTDKIDDSVFEIPEGFKQASRIRIW
jgi:hypothetical protein